MGIRNWIRSGISISWLGFVRWCANGILIVNSPLSKFVNWQLTTGQLDHWTSYHIAAGIFIAKCAEWLGQTDFWCVMWVVIIGVAWEIFEYIVEGTEETYGTKSRWAYNTGADLFVEIGAAWWIMI